MRFILTCLLALFVTTAYAVVEDGDQRDHSSINEIKKILKDSITEITRDQMDTIGKGIGVELKPGWVLVAIAQLNDAHECVATVVCVDKNPDAPTINARNDHYILVIYQEDQTKFLAQLSEIFVDQDQVVPDKASEPKSE